ncbi:MAG TPA: DUF4919 domain-containing protein [Rhizomicrobium sp.]|nr:DUF4919 domain-containing protein [Rhizomicrobium sp.]
MAAMLGGTARAEIVLPNDGDDYSALVAKAMAHDAGTDFRALRLAYVKSAAFKRADSAKLADLKKDMEAAMQNADGAVTVRQDAEAILSIDFTDLYAQKILHQSCKLVHDDACDDLHHVIEFSLLRSITDNGDGKSCATGWPVVQIKEEYFMLAMMGVKMRQQALVNGGGHMCDAMTGIDDKGAEVTWFFNADVVLANEAAMLGIKQ